MYEPVPIGATVIYFDPRSKSRRKGIVWGRVFHKRYLRLFGRKLMLTMRPLGDDGSYQPKAGLSTVDPQDVTVLSVPKQGTGILREHGLI